MALTLEPKANRNKKVGVKRKPSVVLANTGARHQASDLSGGRPTTVMALMAMAQDSGKR